MSAHRPDSTPPGFFRFTAEDVEGTQPWPQDLPLPRELAEVTDSAPHVLPSLPLPGGVYHGCHPDGQLRFLAHLEKGCLVESLVLAAGRPEGRWQKALDAEIHRSCGRFEVYRDETDFDLAHHSVQECPLPFEDWVRGHLPRTTFIDDARTLPRPLSGDGGVTPRLKHLVTHPRLPASGWCRRELHASGVGRDFCNLVPPACSWAWAPVERRPEFQCALVPTWEGIGALAQVDLPSLPLYAYARDLAETLGNARQPPGGYPGGISTSGNRVFPSWVKHNADANPVALARQGRLPWPVLWTLPELPQRCCGFWLAQRHVMALLAQEITRDTELAALARAAHGSRFMQCASIAGAFLLSLSACATLAPDPTLRPWNAHPDALASLQSDRADLVASLQHPLLPSLGSWAWRRGGAPVEVPRAATLLGRFLNDRRASLEERLRATRQGVLYWESSEEQEWARPGQRSSPASASLTWVSRAWEAAADARSHGPGQHHDPRTWAENLVRRLPILGRFVTGTGNPREAADLEAYLCRHPGLTHEQRRALHRILATAANPGPGYSTLLRGALWVISGVAPRAEEHASWMETAVHLAQWMLPLL